MHVTVGLESAAHDNRVEGFTFKIYLFFSKCVAALQFQTKDRELSPECFLKVSVL